MSVTASRSLRLLSWNVNGGRDAQVAGILAANPDVVALQEVRQGSLAAFQALPGYTCLDSARHGRTNFNLVASRWPLRMLPPTEVPYPERVLSVEIDTPWEMPIELHNVHIPDGSTYELEKIETFEGIFKRLACPADASRLRILCGDFNTPREELPDGRIVTWGQVKDNNGCLDWDLREMGNAEYAKRWDRGERLILDTLQLYDLPDVFRMLHGYGVAETSWRNRRYDHIYASASLKARTCEYLHALDGLSDHTPVVAYFAP